MKMEELVTLDIIGELCKTLAAQNIDCCYWKSNTFLYRSKSGDNDLDLLVTRGHAHRELPILAK
jgi:hypothetical protein